MQPVILKIIGRVVIASTLMVSTLACGIQERLTTRPCSIPESSGSVSTEKLTDSSKLTVDGIGPIKVGMTVAEASKAAGTPLVSLIASSKLVRHFHTFASNRIIRGSASRSPLAVQYRWVC